MSTTRCDGKTIYRWGFRWGLYFGKSKSVLCACSGGCSPIELVLPCFFLYSPGHEHYHVSYDEQQYESVWETIGSGCSIEVQLYAYSLFRSYPHGLLYRRLVCV